MNKMRKMLKWGLYLQRAASKCCKKSKSRKSVGYKVGDLALLGCSVTAVLISRISMALGEDIFTVKW